MSSVSNVRSDCGERTYQDSVNRGFYQPASGGLTGKYDNVRSYWEDQLTRLFLRPYVKQLLASRHQLRVLDLGCGAGQGYELLTLIQERDLSVGHEQNYVLQAGDLELYLGIDLSRAMVEQGERNYAHLPNVQYKHGDLREGLKAVDHEPAFDIYFSSYGSLSHLDDAAFKRLLRAIIDHAQPGALIVLDLLGRYSLEWPEHWLQNHEHDHVYEYSMSYLYKEAERENGHIERFMMRYWTDEEIHAICKAISVETGTDLKVLKLMDRSLMVGRHVDTQEYGTCLPPLRSAINHLHEDYQRTPLDELIVDYQPVDGFPELNTFFSELCYSWNEIVRFAIAKLDNEHFDLVDIEGWNEFSPALQMAMMNMDRVVDSVAWMRFGDARANVIEPQLGYLLRTLETNLQQGRGYGHSLLGVLQVNK